MEFYSENRSMKNETTLKGFAGARKNEPHKCTSLIPIFSRKNVVNVDILLSTLNCQRDRT